MALPDSRVLTTARRLYVGWQWRLVRLAVGACLVALLVAPVEPAAGARTTFGILAVLLIASAVPWTRIPWNEVYANIQQQKLGFETSGSYLSQLQKERYANYLSAKVKDVATVPGPEVQVMLDVSSQLLWDLFLQELHGCAALDGAVESGELRLVQSRSRPVLPRLRTRTLQVGFPVSGEVHDRLCKARERNEEVHWSFDVELAVKFSSGETGIWTAKDLAYHQVPAAEC